MCINRNWIVDIDAVWLAPIQHQNLGAVGLGYLDPASTAHNVIIDPSLEFDTRNNSDFTLSPRITFGIQGECWGVLARYWRLQTGCVDGLFAPGYGEGRGGEGLQPDSAFKAETLDLEVTRLLGGDCKDNMYRASFGFRYAQLQEAANLGFSDSVGADNFYQTDVFTKHDFSGPGVTMGLQGLHRVNCSNFNLFFDVRASLLFDANDNEYVATRADWVGGTGSAHQFDEAGASSNANLFIGEIQLGGQWNLPLKCIPANAFVRLAFEYQYWATSHSGIAESISAAGPVAGPLGFAAGQSSGNTHIDLVGFNIGTGLTW
jgi:hypothetical protein